MPCDSCPKRRTCTKICSQLEAKLPKLHDSVAEGHLADDEYWMKIYGRRRALHRALDRRVCLHGREREILDMALNRSMSVNRAAHILGVSRTWVKKVLGRTIARKSRKAAVEVKRSQHEMRKPG